MSKLERIAMDYAKSCTQLADVNGDVSVLWWKIEHAKGSDKLKNGGGEFRPLELIRKQYISDRSEDEQYWSWEGWHDAVENFYGYTSEQPEIKTLLLELADLIEKRKAIRRERGMLTRRLATIGRGIANR